MHPCPRWSDFLKKRRLVTCSELARQSSHCFHMQRDIAPENEFKVRTFLQSNMQAINVHRQKDCRMNFDLWHKTTLCRDFHSAHCGCSHPCTTDTMHALVGCILSHLPISKCNHTDRTTCRAPCSSRHGNCTTLMLTSYYSDVLGSDVSAAQVQDGEY